MTTRTSIHDVRKVVAEEQSATNEYVKHKWTNLEFYDSKGNKIYSLVVHHSEQGVKYEWGSYGCEI